MNCFLHGAVSHYKDWSGIIGSIDSTVGFAPNLYRYTNYELNKSARLINKFNDEAETLIGYSMGGRLALHCLLESNSKWEKAVIISAHTGLKSETEKLNRVKSDINWADSAIKNWDSFIQSWESQSIFKNSQPIKRDYSLSHHKRNIASSFQNWSLGNQKFLEPLLKKIRIPVLWIVGDLDFKFLEIADRACKILPNAELVKLKSTGHRVPWDNPTQTLNTINNFI